MLNSMSQSVVARLVQKFGSQAKLAKAAGVTQPSVHEWAERGIVPAHRMAAILKSARELGIDLDPAELVPTPAEDAA